MNENRKVLLSLSAVIRQNLQSITVLSTEAQLIVKNWDVQSQTFAGRAALGYILHNIYNALEDCFEQISRTFENHVVDERRWHAELLSKMFLEIPTVRRAIFTPDLRSFMNDLRGFRHVFRHSYEHQLKADKLYVLVTSWFNAEQAIFFPLCPHSAKS